MAPRQRADERDRHLLPHPPGPQRRRLPLPRPLHARTSAVALEQKVRADHPRRRHRPADALRRPRAGPGDRPAAAGRAAPDQQAPRDRRGRPRRRGRARTRPSRSWSTRRTTSASRSSAAACSSKRRGSRSTRSTTRSRPSSTSAFHPRFGYLTACPTNVGTGIRVSVMLHLPALKLTGEIEKVFRAAKDMRLAVRGLYGEGTEATGDFYPDQQPDHARQDRRRHHRRLQARRDPQDHRLRAPRPQNAAERPHGRAGRQGLPRPGPAPLRPADGQRRDAAPAQPPPHGRATSAG